MFVVTANLLGALCAVVANIWASSHTTGWIKWFFTLTAGLALVYSLSFLWLLFHFGQAAAWSQFMRPVGIVAWPIAWSVEPLLIVRYFHKKADELVVMGEKAAHGGL